MSEKKNTLVPALRHRLETLCMIIGVFALLASCSSAPLAQGTNPNPPQATQPPASTATQPAVSVATQPAVSAPVDACSLLTKQEVEATIGESVGDPKPGNWPPTYSCDYETANLDKVSIIVTDFVTAQNAADAFQMVIDINHYPEVNGIGERAFRSDCLISMSLKHSMI